MILINIVEKHWNFQQDGPIRPRHAQMQFCFAAVGDEAWGVTKWFTAQKDRTMLVKPQLVLVDCWLLFSFFLINSQALLRSLFLLKPPLLIKLKNLQRLPTFYQCSVGWINRTPIFIGRKLFHRWEPKRHLSQRSNEAQPFQGSARKLGLAWGGKVGKLGI